jgi:hypothetical protein
VAGPNQTATLALVATLSNGQADPTLAMTFYTDVLTRLALQQWHTTATPITVTSKNSTVNFPGNLLELLMFIYDNDVLSNLMLRELEALTPAWRNSYGRPIAYTLETETAKSGELFPVPNQAPKPIIPVHGLPLGEDYQPGNAIAIFVQSPPDILPILVLPVALKILAREYSRESNHTDLNYATFAETLADLLLKALLRDGTAKGQPPVEEEG